jgi:predicted ATPase
LDDRFPPLKTLDARHNNLPVQVTTFVGRAELAAARAALAQTRLLSLTGPGGTGKTRLALQLAAAVSDEFADGVFLVPLDAISDGELVVPAIAAALGLTPSGTAPPLDQLLAFLRELNVLLVLDNFEQVVDAAPIVGQLLRAGPGVKILVTTRIVLRIYGERELPVPPLGLPPAHADLSTAELAGRYEAVELFVDRARAVQPQFTLTEENARLVVDIVRRLDGLPLAIELAAARTRSLPVAAIHARLDQHLSLLTGGSRDLPGRQQTLRGAIDWSYDLLEGPDRTLFERFSVHAGGAFLSEADAVCGPPQELGEEVLDGLTSLSEKSLVRPELTGNVDPRYSMLTTIRDYAHERLETRDDFASLARRHAETYLGLLERLAPELTGAEGRGHADRLEQDHDNLRMALDWAVANGETAYALRFIAAIWRFWQVRGHLVEARRRVDAVISLPHLAEQTAELRARGLGAAGSICYWQADVPATHDYYTRAVAAARASGDDALIAEALYNLGFAPLDQESINNTLYIAGEEPWREALELYRRLDDPRGVADASWGIAMARAAQDDRAAAVEYGLEALAGYRRVGDPFRAGWGLYLLAGLTVPTGDLEQAERYLRESLETFSQVDDRAGILLNLTGFQMLASSRKQRTRANRLGGAVEALRAATGASLVDSPIEVVDFVLPVKPTEPPAIAEWEQGARMSAAEAAAYALGDVDADFAETDKAGIRVDEPPG